MVVLSIAIGTKAGKLLLCRDFSDISRTLVEDCVSSLPQLIKETQEHTFVEHNNLRLNYLPLGALFLLSINDRGSNILDDIEVLRSVQSALHWILSDGVTEEKICLKAIDIIFALDDLISLGYRNISSESLLSNALEMDSANERLMLLQKEQQEKDAKKRAQDWEREQKKKLKLGKSIDDALPGATSPQPDRSAELMKADFPTRPFEEVETQKTSTADGKKTLKIGTQKKKEKIKEANETGQTETSKPKEEVAFNPLDSSVKFSIVERLECELDREGKLLKFGVKGDISFTIQNPKVSRLAILVESKKKAQFAPKVPPAFNKKMWTEDSVLMPRDDNTSFQPSMAVPAIKYSFEKDKGGYFPLSFSIWLADKSITVECEFNSAQTWVDGLASIVVTMPNAPSKPSLCEKANSDFSFDAAEKTVKWTIPKLNAASSEASINLEFASGLAKDSLFPWSVDFVASKPFGDFEVKMVKNLENDEDLKFETAYDLKLQNTVN